MVAGELEHRTTDLALATVLNMRGFSHQRIEMVVGRNQCAWIFRETRALLEAVDEFGAGEALVNPIDFAYELSSMRKEMFAWREANGGNG